MDSLAGVPGGSSFLGTFEREEAVEDESIDFFASGHPLVEGILGELEEGPIGRTAILHVDAGGERGFGLFAVYKEGRVFEVVAVDSNRRQRPDWAELLSRRPLRTKRVRPETLTKQPGWAETIRRLSEDLGRPQPPVALAALLVGKGG